MRMPALWGGLVLLARLLPIFYTKLTLEIDIVFAFSSASVFNCCVYCVVRAFVSNSFDPFKVDASYIKILPD